MVIAQHIRPDGSFLLVLAGELDIASADEVRQAGVSLVAKAAGDGPVVVDLMDVSFMDSTGLAALIAIKNAAEDTGSTFTLMDPSPRVRRILEITHLSGVFAVLESRQPTDDVA